MDSAPDGTGYYEIKNNRSSMCLVPNGVAAGVGLVRDNCNPFYRWHLDYRPVSGHTFTYQLRYVYNSQCITLPRASNGVLPYMDDCSADPTPRQGSPVYNPQLFWVAEAGGPI